MAFQHNNLGSHNFWLLQLPSLNLPLSFPDHAAKSRLHMSQGAHRHVDLSGQYHAMENWGTRLPPVITHPPEDQAIARQVAIRWRHRPRIRVCSSRNCLTTSWQPSLSERGRFLQSLPRRVLLQADSECCESLVSSPWQGRRRLVANMPTNLETSSSGGKPHSMCLADSSSPSPSP